MPSIVGLMQTCRRQGCHDLLSRVFQNAVISEAVDCSEGTLRVIDNCATSNTRRDEYGILSDPCLAGTATATRLQVS